MKVGLWAEIRRLAEIEKLSARVISRRLHCSWRTVAQALEWEQPPARSDPSRVSRSRNPDQRRHKFPSSQCHRICRERHDIPDCRPLLGLLGLVQ